MRTSYLDYETLSLAYEALDCIKIIKVLNERALGPYLCEPRIIATEDCVSSYKWYFLEENYGIIFDTSEVSYYIINCEELKDSEDEYEQKLWNEFGEEVAGWFNSEEISVCGIFIKHPLIMKLLDWIEENDLDMDKLDLYKYFRVNNTSGSWESYFEFFIAKNTRDFGVCILYTDPMYFTSELMENYFDFLDRIDALLISPIRDEWRKSNA